MNPEMLALLNDPNYTVSEVNYQYSDTDIKTEHRRSFEMLAGDGEVIGYIRTWHDQDEYAGFVQFDAEGNVTDWRAFYKTPGLSR